MAYLYPYGDTQQLNLDWLIEQWNEVKSQIDGSLQAEIDRVEAAITDLLTARDEAVAAQTAAQASAQAAAGSASTASGAASTATAQAQAAAGSAATAGAHASDAQGYAATAQQAAQAANNSAGAAAVSEGNARNSETAAAGSSSAAAGNALYAEGYAKGTQNGNPVSSGSPYYENNAKYYSDQAAQDASDAADAAILLKPPATSADIGKALIVKTVGGGTVTSYELGESGGGGGTPAIINTIENVPIASFDDGTVNPVHKIVVEIKPLQSGSGDPSPDNVRPITGWTEANVKRTGKNLFNGTIINGREPINVLVGETYTVSADMIDPNIQTYLYLQRSLNGTDFTTFAQVITGSNVNARTFTAEDGYTYVVWSNGTYSNVKDVQIEYGSTASSYEPYAGTTYPITFPTEAGTVYGGTLTNQGTNEWVLSINMLNIIFNDNTASFRAGTDGNPNAARIALSSDVYGSFQDRLKMVSDQYNIISTTASVDKSMRLTGSSSTPYSEWIIIYDTRFTDEQTMQTILAATPVQIVYPLYQPIEYTITTADVITLLIGYNNVWADTGNINLLQYYADSKKYIDDQDTLIKALIAKELPDMTADAALVANDFRIVNNTLYRVTAPIASGGTLTPGTNCTATTITEVLKSLL